MMSAPRIRSKGVESSGGVGREGKRDQSREWDDRDMEALGGEEGKLERMLWDRLARTEG